MHIWSLLNNIFYFSTKHKYFSNNVKKILIIIKQYYCITNNNNIIIIFKNKLRISIFDRIKYKNFNHTIIIIIIHWLVSVYSN